MPVGCFWRWPLFVRWSFAPAGSFGLPLLLTATRGLIISVGQNSYTVMLYLEGE